MKSNNQIGNMEQIFHILGDMKLTKKQHSKFADMLRLAFINGFHTALVDSGMDDDSMRMEMAMQSETCQHIVFLAQENNK